LVIEARKQKIKTTLAELIYKQRRERQHLEQEQAARKIQETKERQRRFRKGLPGVHGELVVKPEPGVDTTHDIGFANQNSINFHLGASFFRHI